MPGSKPDRALYGFLRPSEIELQKEVAGGGGDVLVLGFWCQERLSEQVQALPVKAGP